MAPGATDAARLHAPPAAPFWLWPRVAEDQYLRREAEEWAYRKAPARPERRRRNKRAAWRRRVYVIARISPLQRALWYRPVVYGRALLNSPAVNHRPEREAR